MENSVFCRKRKPQTFDYESPYPLENGEVLIDEKGNRKFVKREPVLPSLAKDYDVLSNRMRLGSNGIVVTSREVFDPVDLLEKHPEIANL